MALIKLLQLLLCGSFVICPSQVFAQLSKYTVEGKILFEGTGDIHIFLVTEERFKTPLEGLQELVLEIGPDEIRKKKAFFRLEGVEQGRYGIRCFQDVNGNGKLDKGLFGPSEPWGMSWQRKKPSGWPRFKGIAFEVNSNIRDIRIELN